MFVRVDRDGMIQHLKVSIHCHKNITIHRYIVIMSQDWQNVLLKVIINNLTLVVNWRLCLVSHNQITFIPFCECINRHKMQSDLTKLIKSYSIHNYVYCTQNVSIFWGLYRYTLHCDTSMHWYIIIPSLRIEDLELWLYVGPLQNF